MSTKINIGDKQNWYAKFDPVGSYNNVYLLIPGRTEWNATVIARKAADKLGQPLVTLRRLVPKDKTEKVLTW